ncbi:MAG: hypothetical protein PHS14_06315 [Elusimicrobia bacterium]|nr:hypothetical protein [Elusimicrobiota bacterium]
MPIFIWLLGAALSASAHDLYPIRPVRATLLVEPDRIVADLRADSIVWIEEVTGLHPMPPRDWSAETLAKVEAYANAHFRLSADGSPLEGRLVSARYRQLPWEVNEEGVFFLRLVYPSAPAGGSFLTGSARFYEEYRKELEGEFGNRPLPFREGYRTLVDVPGRRRLAFTLTTEAPSFTASIDEARRTAPAMALESLQRGAQAPLGAAAGFPALLAIALCLGAKRPGRAAVAALPASAACGFAAGSFLVAPAWLIWAATLGGALATGRAGLALPVGASAVGCLGLAWAQAAGPLLPHFALAVPSALAGALAAGGALLAVARSGVRAEYRRLATVSESRVEELFARRARLTATALAMVGAYGLWQSLQR